jgi:hypothetical protein
MIEPTITQNSALYLAHHKASKRKPFFERLGLVAREEGIIIKQQRAFNDLLLWRPIHRADKR